MLYRDEADILVKHRSYFSQVGGEEKKDTNSRPSKTIEVTEVSNESHNIINVNEMQFHTRRESHIQSQEEIELDGEEKENSQISGAGKILKYTNTKLLLFE